MQARRSLRVGLRAWSRGISQLLSPVNDELRAAYARDGVVCVRGAFDKAWVERLREAGELNMASPGPLCDEHVPEGLPGRFHDDQFLWRRSSVFRDFVFNSQAAAVRGA